MTTKVSHRASSSWNKARKNEEALCDLPSK